ncbi:MAG: hypothetical protein C6H99_04210 [Epsilonproteobacteria bacterium]|nr:hypothetical protein [Campylobacterota bacterium]
MEPQQLFLKSFPLAGTFHPYPFYPKDDPKSAFNWVFQTPSGNLYQMMGATPDQHNVFGWKRIEQLKLPDPVWDFYFIGDIDGDGDTRFDFILTASKYKGKIYKLLPTPIGDFFRYQDLGFINYTKDERSIWLSGEAIIYLGLFDSLRSTSYPQTMAIVDPRGLEEFLEKYHPPFGDKLKSIDLEHFNIALFSFTLNGAEHIQINPPRFIAPKVAYITTNVFAPEIGIRSVVFYTFAVAASKQIQRVVFEIRGKEYIINFPDTDCSGEPQMPVCGLKQVECITAPCDPIPYTYPNYCSLKEDGATFLHMGPCEAVRKTDPKEVARSVSKTGALLTRELYTKSNIFLSPFSIATALHMVYFGASGQTKEEFERFFGYTKLDVPSSIREYIARIAPHSNRLEIANSAWFEREFGVYRSYEQMVKDFLHSEIYRKDFLHDPDVVRQEINEWVELKTHQKIKDLLPQGSISSDTRAVLVNAVYFLGEWMAGFDEDETKREPFYLLGGDTKEVWMMNGWGDYNRSEGQSYEALELPYKDHELSLWILLPKEGYHIEDILDEIAQRYTDLYTRRIEGEVEIKVPKFQLEWGTKELSNTLKRLGLVRAFDRYEAEFEYLGSPIDPSGRLFIDGLYHKAYIEVDEKGSEAAAATAAVMVETTAMMERAKFYANRPFVFMIVENSLNTPLFMGVLVEP